MDTLASFAQPRSSPVIIVHDFPRLAQMATSPARATQESAPVHALLIPLTWPYAAAMRARNARYDRARGVRTALVPVISVGNITTGGTGKTPLVMAIVRRLLAEGRRPAIVTRGYAARAGEVPDEVLEFRAALPGVPVVIDPDRVAGAS